MESLDVRGLSCPLPVLKVKKALDKGLAELKITGDSKVSLENVTRYASSQGFAVELQSEPADEWTIKLKK